MSKRRQEIYDFIKMYIDKNSYSPSMREIAIGVGLSSSSTVKEHLDRLQRDGYIEFQASKPHTIRVLEPCH